MLEGIRYMVGRSRSEYHLLFAFGESLVCVAVEPERDVVEVARTMSRRLTTELVRSLRPFNDLRGGPEEQHAVLVSKQKRISK